MIIKCPQCSTGYNLPEKLFTDKPRKMRCSRCQYVFTITRRQEQAPTGYEEFTGKQHLPDEFAFLKQTQPEQAPSQPPAQAPPDGLYDSVAGASADQTDTIPLEPRVVSGPTREPAAPQPPPAAAQPAPAEPVPPEPETAPEPTPTPAEPQAPSQPTPPAAEAPRPSSPSDIYGATSAWEMEAPLELGGYAIADEQPSSGTGQAMGKFMTVIVALVVIFFVFVAWRNGWSISFSDLPDQIGFAFSGGDSDAIAPEARDIEVTVSERRLVIADDKASYLVVTGTVFNPDTVGRNQVVLRGRLLDLAGELSDETRGPCGKVVEDEAIKATAKGAIGGHFRSSGALADCAIKPEGDNVFQLIFENVPLDYSPDFTVEVVAVSADVHTPI
jgi:predicted Zn finger-like uncharacterized protein